MRKTRAGIRMPAGAPAREASELLRDTEAARRFQRSRRVFLSGAATGNRRERPYGTELL